MSQKQSPSGRTKSADTAQQKWLLYSTSIICGATLMALEIIGGRLLSPYFGSSVYVWGSIISVFLIALSAGYYFGGTAADKRPSTAILALFIAAAGLLILLIPSLLLPFVKFAYSAGFGNYGTLVVSMLLFFLPSLGLGMVSPYIIKLGTIEASRLGNSVGKFYSVSTFGSIIGTLATTFMLIPWFGVRNIILSLGIILLVLAIFILIRQRLLPQSAVTGCLMLGVLFLVALPSPVTAGTNDERPVLYEKESMYNNLRVEDEGFLRYLMFDNIEQSAANKFKPGQHIWPYTRLMVAAANKYRPEATDFLAIGIGGGSVVTDLVTNNKNCTFDAVDIDPEVIKVAYDYFGLPKDSRLQATAADGRMFIRDKKKKYDVIFVDAYNRLSIPYHLTTKEFFGELQNSLKPGGIVMFNVISSIDGYYSPFFKSFLNTGRQVFPEYLLFMTETQDPEEQDNLAVMMSKDKFAPPGNLAGCTQYTQPVDLSSALVLTDDYAPVEALALPIMSDI